MTRESAARKSPQIRLGLALALGTLVVLAATVALPSRPLTARSPALSPSKT